MKTEPPLCVFCGAVSHCAAPKSASQSSAEVYLGATRTCSCLACSKLAMQASRSNPTSFSHCRTSLKIATSCGASSHADSVRADAPIRASFSDRERFMMSCPVVPVGEHNVIGKPAGASGISNFSCQIARRSGEKQGVYCFGFDQTIACRIAGRLPDIVIVPENGNVGPVTATRLSAPLPPATSCGRRRSSVRPPGIRDRPDNRPSRPSSKIRTARPAVPPRCHHRPAA